jgi:transcriptional regulator with XRE-family HTH domain
MQDIQLGARFRATRIRLGLRQLDVARQAGVSDATVSRLERGHLDTLSVGSIRAVAGTLEIRVELLPRWRGGDLDRLVNARHARLAECYVGRLEAPGGWTVRPEVSFAIFGERGIIDLLAWHAARCALLVVELKTEIVDVGELLGTLDRKARLARRIASDLDWQARSVSVALIVAEGHTNHRRIEAHRAVFRAALPDDGRRLRGWLRDPIGRVAAIAFVPDRHPGKLRTAMSTPRRVSARRGTVRGAVPSTD